MMSSGQPSVTTMIPPISEGISRESGLAIVDPNCRHGSFLFLWRTKLLGTYTKEDRTSAVGGIIKCVGELIPGIRNELYPVTSSFGTQILFSLERAAAPYFGIKAYGVHMNGYVIKGGQKFLWVGKRSDSKPTYPGMLDHLVAGGLVVGAVSYMDIEGYRFKRDVLFCYDLELSSDFVPNNEDGEVDSFKLIPVVHVANIVRRTEFFKPNCALVIMDFLFRHGFIGPHDFGYLSLLHGLRSGIVLEPFRATILVSSSC